MQRRNAQHGRRAHPFNLDHAAVRPAREGPVLEAQDAREGPGAPRALGAPGAARVLAAPHQDLGSGRELVPVAVREPQVRAGPDSPELVVLELQRGAPQAERHDLARQAVYQHPAIRLR
jgi:hypothetical protein